MRCPEASEAMSLRLDLDLSTQQEQAFQEHLVVCERCRSEWQMLQQMDALLAQVGFAIPSPLFTQKVMVKIQRRAAWLNALRAGAVFVLMLVILATLGIAPLITLSFFIGSALSTPSLVAALVGVMMRLLNISSALLRAVALMVEAFLGGPNCLLMIGYLLLAGALVLLWMRLVSRHLRPVDYADVS